MPLKNLTKIEIETALARLADLARQEGIRLEMTLYGGAVMLLAYDARQVTKDVDAIVYPPEVARRLAARVAREQGWSEDWLHDDVRPFVSQRETKHVLQVPAASAAGLHVTRPTAHYLLAMKVMACRKPLPGHPGDRADLEFLIRKLRLKAVDQIETIVNRYFPDTVLPDATRQVLTALLDPHG